MEQDVTITKGKAVNQPGGNTLKFFSTFPLSYPKLWTYRYGELGLIFSENNITKDDFYWRLPHEIKSLMLKAPIMQNLKVYKNSFWVTRQTILPNSWENLERFETQGDSAPIDANTVIYNFEQKIMQHAEKWWSDILQGAEQEVLIDENGYDTGLLNQIFHWIIYFEMFYTTGNLMANSGHPMYSLWINTKANNRIRNSYGYFFDKIIEEIFTVTDKLEFTHGNWTGYVVKSNPSETEIDIRTALCYMRDDPNFEITTAEQDDISQIVEDINNDDEYKFSIYELDQDEEARPFNYERLCAYQLAVAEYYTNDKIDYVYNAQLYRQLMSTYLLKEYNIETYNYNGITITYDWLSGHYFTKVLNDLKTKNILTEWDDIINLMSYVYGIFNIKRSLRFKDYFTGARSKPLAVMDYNVEVNEDNEVSVINIMEKRLWAKLGNAMNKVGNDIKKQTRELLGIDMHADYHVPFYLGETVDYIGNTETENTGEGQFNLPENAQGVAITSRFVSNAGSNIFKTYFDRKGVFLSIMWFEIPRLYSKAVSRFFYVEDKFDEFNPYTQFTGDQAIYKAEKDIRYPWGTTFGYTNNGMQYKQRYGIAGGGFIFDLPGWCFLADRTRSTEKDKFITPDYIRSLQTEIDDLYQSLIGYSIDTYYHFEVKHQIDMTGKRPMAYNPTIGM